jgi:hypothetical protein
MDFLRSAQDAWQGLYDYGYQAGWDTREAVVEPSIEYVQDAVSTVQHQAGYALKKVERSAQASVSSAVQPIASGLENVGKTAVLAGGALVALWLVTKK